MPSHTFNECLSSIVSHPSTHAKWLNTLSYLENCGAKLIASSEHPTMVPEEILKHAAEEFRHAYYLKAQIHKITPQPLLTYQLHEILGSYSTKHYLYRLNSHISRFLIEDKNVDRLRMKEYAYLLVTYAIEIRAKELYPLYQKLLNEMSSQVSVMGIIREEEQHLQEISTELEVTPAQAWKGEVCHLEESIFEEWCTAIKKQVHQR